MPTIIYHGDVIVPVNMNGNKLYRNELGPVIALSIPKAALAPLEDVLLDLASFLSIQTRPHFKENSVRSVLEDFERGYTQFRKENNAAGKNRKEHFLYKLELRSRRNIWVACAKSLAALKIQ